MYIKKRRDLYLALMLFGIVYFVVGCGAMSSGGAGSQWTPGMYDKGGSHIHYAKPPSDKWAVYEDPELSIAYYNKETGSIISFDAEHHTGKTNPKEAFEEFETELKKTFNGKLSVVEEKPTTALGLTGHYAKVEGLREKDQSKVYFIHYFLVKDGKIITFDATQQSTVDESKRQKDLDAFNYFMNNIQFH